MSHAQGDADAAETGAARALAIEGVKLAQADKCSEAVDKLERSETLKHSPIVLRHLGECQVKVGRWVEGSESLRKLLREALPENATPALAAAYESAAATLRDVKPRIPSLKIMLTMPPNTDFTVKVDGKEVADSVVGVALPTDPGEHTVEATAPGFLKASSTMKVQPGSAATVALELKKDPSAKVQALATGAAAATPARAAAPGTEQAPPARATHSSNTRRVLGWTSYAVAAVGLGTGIAFGQSAISDEKSLRSSCPNHVCTPAHEDALDYAKTKGTISTVGFAVAGAGAVLGTVLLLTSSSDSSGNARATRPAAIAGISRPRALLGVGRVALAGDF